MWPGGSSGLARKGRRGGREVMVRGEEEDEKEEEDEDKEEEYKEEEEDKEKESRIGGGRERCKGE